MNNGDVVEVVRRFRRLMAAADAVKASLDGSFSAIDPRLEAAAVQLRPATASCAKQAEAFLTILERTAAYKTATGRDP